MVRLIFLLIAIIACFIGAFGASDNWDHVGVVNEVSSRAELKLNDHGEFLPKDSLKISDDLLNYNEFILDATGGSSPNENSYVVITSADINATDCSNNPIPLDVEISIIPDNYTDTYPYVRVGFTLSCAIDATVCDIDAIGTLSFLVLTGITADGPTNQTQGITISGTWADVRAALAGVVYNPPEQNSNTDEETRAALFLTLIALPTPNSADNIGQSNITFSTIDVRQPPNVPYIYPIDVQAFTNLTGSANTTLTIPPIEVRDLISADDLLYVSIDPTNTGHIAILDDANITYAPVNPQYPQVVAFVGHLDAVNRALASIQFTPTNCTGLFCIDRYGFFVLVKDLANTTICPDVAVILCQLDINANNDRTIVAALPAPVVLNTTSTSVSLTFRSVPLGYNFPPDTPEPIAYAISYSMDPNLQGYTHFEPHAERTPGTFQVYTSPSVLLSDTQYYVVIGMINDAGLSTMVSPPVTFRTAAVGSDSVASISIMSFTSDSITFAFDQVDDSSVTGYIANVNSSTSDIVLIPVANEQVVYVLRGLSSFTPYKISVATRNPYGVSPKTDVTQWTKLKGPQIIGFVASDPDNDDATLDNGDQITITFNIDSNRPAVSTKAEVDSVFFFNQALGDNYDGEWLNARTCVITLRDVTNAAVQLGVLRVKVIGTGDSALYDANSISDFSDAISPLLSGNWGTAGLVDFFNPPDSPLQISENEATYLGVTTNSDVLNASAVYMLSVEILSPQLLSSRLTGQSGNWSDSGLSISISGTSVVLANALDVVLFTPARQYAGPVSFQFSLRDNSSIVVAMLVTTLTIESTNHAPVIIQPESVPAYLNTWSNVVSSSGDFIILNDVDVPVDSVTDVQTLTLSVSHTGLLRFTGSEQVGVKYAPSFDGSHQTLQLTGSLFALNLALTALQVQFEYDVSALSSPAQYFLAIQFNDDANGGAPALTTYGVVQFNLECPSSLDNVVPTTIDGVSFTGSGNQVRLVLTLPVLETVLYSQYFDCASVFTSSSVALFGNSPTCQWSDTHTVDVTLGLGTTLTVNSTVSLQSNSLPRCPNGEPATSTRSALVNVGVGSNSPVAPVVSISGPEWASACRSLTLTGEVFQSSSHIVRYSWGLPLFFNSELANIQPVAPSTLHTPFLILNSSAFTKFSNPPSSYEFTLTVVDFLGQIAKSSYSVSLDRDIKPFIKPISQAFIQTYRNEPLSIYANADLPDCGAASLLTLDPRITYSWSVSPSIDGFTLPSSSNLFVPANILSYYASADHRYIFTLRAAMTGNPALYTEQHFTVEVLLNALTPRIAGGDIRSIKYISALSVDASKSYDVDVSPSGTTSDYVFSWSCMQLAPFSMSSTVCTGANGAPLALPHNATLTYSAGHLVPNVYIFTVRWWHPSTSRMGSASQMVRVVEFDTTADVSVDTVKLVVNSFDRVSVQSTASGPTNFTLSWTTESSSSRSISYNSSTNNLFLNNERAADYFEPGATYQVTEVTTDIDGLVATASIAFYVNRPPVCSQLSLSPSFGVAMSTYFSFLIASGDCFDPDGDANDPIYFQYFRIDSTGRKIFLTPATTNNLVEQIALSAGPSVTVGVRISDRLGAYSELTTTVTVTPNSLASMTDLLALYEDQSAEALERGDAVMVVNAINNILMAASTITPPLSTSNMTELKGSLINDLLSQASSLPDPLILQSLSLIFSDSSSVSVPFVSAALEYINSIDSDSALVPAILDSISQFIVDAGILNNSGRRLLSVLDSETLVALIQSYVHAVNSVLSDYSMNYLTYDGDVYRFTQSLLHGAIFRSVAPATASSQVSVDGSSVFVPLGAFPSWTPTNIVDLALYVVPQDMFSFASEDGQVSGVVNVVAFVPSIQVSPYSPRTVASRELNPMPSGTSIPVRMAFDAVEATDCLNVPVGNDNVCTLECRVWDSSSAAFVTAGISTDFGGINSNSTTVTCYTSGTASIALFRTVRNPTILSSSTGSSDSGASTGAVIDESDAVRVSVDLTVTSRSGFRQDFIQDIGALMGQPVSRFNFESAGPADDRTHVVFVILGPETSTGATALDIYESLRSLTLFDVLSTTYVRYADLNSWKMQCPDFVFRDSCNSSTQAAWMLPVVVIAAVLGAILMCCVAAVVVRRYRSIDTKDKGVEETMPSAAVGAKQFFYTPNAPEATPSGSSTDEVESDVTIVGGVEAITSASIDEEEISEPIVVENEADAAAIAKLPISNRRTSQRTIEEAEEEEELSANTTGSLSVSESHFVYVDESKRDSSRTSEGSREFSRSGSSAMSASHFRVPATGAEGASREESISRSTSSRRASSNNSAMHFRYSDDRTSEVSTSRTPSLPHLNEPHSPSHSSRRSQNLAFSTTNDNRAQQSKTTEKKAIRVVRPGQH